MGAPKLILLHTIELRVPEELRIWLEIIAYATKRRYNAYFFAFTYFF